MENKLFGFYASIGKLENYCLTILSTFLVLQLFAYCFSFSPKDCIFTRVFFKEFLLHLSFYASYDSEFLIDAFYL